MNPADNTFDDALTGTLRQAVAQINEQPVPKAALRHVLDRLENWPEPLRLQQQRRRRFWAASTLAASIVFFIAWLAWPSDGWAQVVQAMQQKQWIRMTSTVEGEPSVNWISLPRSIIAWRRGDAGYHDSRLKVIYRYDESAKTIYRLPEDDESRKTLLATRRLFTGILQNKNELDGTIQERMEVIHQERHDITSEGKKLIEYHLQCRPKDQHDARLSMIFQVDPSTHLAQKLILKNLTPRSKDEPNELQFQIDYPDQGPLDIYDLGVARTSKYIDRIPPEDVDRTVHAIKLNRETFDSYHGLLVQLNQQPFAQIWRKGKKWRIEFSKKAVLLAQPVGLTDPTTWWLDQAKAITWHAHEVCDGTTIYTPDGKNYLPDEQSINNSVTRSFNHDFGLIGIEWGIARLVMPEVIGYPIPQVGFQQVSVEVKPTPEKGPVDTFQLLTHFTTRQQGAAHLQRFWIDPSRSYLVMRHEIGEWDTRPEHLDWRQIERMDRTPSGIWYPQVVKGTGGTMHFYLNFKAELPDELFTPTERKKK